MRFLGLLSITAATMIIPTHSNASSKGLGPIVTVSEAEKAGNTEPNNKYHCLPGGPDDPCLVTEDEAYRYCVAHGTRLPTIYELAKNITPTRVSLVAKKGYH